VLLALVGSLQTVFLPGLKRQARAARRHKIDSLEMFMKNNGSGQVSDVLVYPESQLAGCTSTGPAERKVQYSAA